MVGDIISEWWARSRRNPQIGRYLNFYNSKRPHSSLDHRTPDQAYFNAPQPIPAAA